ncbi:MAG: FISUMP domain-containing protein [Melioribacteraceae bacterium]|nr:FISUMP domain-containing protein [Melioribacteraceae bacterium]
MSSSFSLKIHLLVLITIFFTSCSQDENNPIDPNNIPPRIVVLSASPSILFANETTELTCYAADEDNDILTYSWNALEGNFPNGKSGQIVYWIAPETIGEFKIEISVSDAQSTVKDTLILSVIDDPCEGLTKINYAGLDYNLIPIGKQCWMKENLNVGTMINDSLEMTNQDTVEKYCYDNDLSNCDKYGGLYQWNEAMMYSLEENSMGICPPGWHIPSFEEYQTLKFSVNNSGNALKSIGQGTGLGSGTNTSGFSALLAGMRFDDTNFGNFSEYGIFWSSTFDLRTYDAAYYLYLDSEDDDLLLDYGNIFIGVSVRCLKD